MNSKRKGNRAERELVELLGRYGVEAHRNDQRYIGGADNPDLSCTMNGLPIHIEAKRTERLALHAAVQQAIRDANGHALPVVMHRRSREPWLVTLSLDDLMRLLKGHAHAQ